jgi:hypothetical protein
LTVRGCTFYGNSTGATGSDAGGAAIYATGGTSSIVNLTGNLFFGNTGMNPVVVAVNDARVVSGGYNVVDVAFGTGSEQAGWTAAATDTTFAALSITGNPFDTSTFVPLSALRIVMPGTALENFPARDFYGEDRDWPGAPGAVR